MFNFKTFNIYRTSDPNESASNYKIAYADTGSIITGNLKPAGAEYSMIVDGQFGKTYIFRSDDFNADVQIGDRLKDDDEWYEVKGLSLNDDGPGRNVTLTVISVIKQT